MYIFHRNSLGIGICYITAHVVISMYLPEMWPMMDSYMAKPLLVKLLLLPIWVKVIFHFPVI